MSDTPSEEKTETSEEKIETPEEKTEVPDASEAPETPEEVIETPEEKAEAPAEEDGAPEEPEEAAAQPEEAGETEAQPGEAAEEQDETTQPAEETNMNMRWYVVHTYSGHENKVKLSLEERIKLYSKQNMFGDILIPSEKVVEVVKGKKRETSRKFFPGYILVNMELDNETWHIVRDTPKVTGFVGGSSPTPISDQEVSNITQQISEGMMRPKPKISFEKGDSVRVNDGPFTNFSGTVDEVRPDKGKVRVLVSIFGRSTPIELDFVQVEKN